jgi:hypothetical protein
LDGHPNIVLYDGHFIPTLSFVGFSETNFVMPVVQLVVLLSCIQLVGHEITASFITELKGLWHETVIVHGKLRHPQSQI